MVALLNPLSRLFLRMWFRSKLGRATPPVASNAVPVTFPLDRVKVAAVQWNAEPVGAVEDWTRRVTRFFEEAADTHCHLLAFPEYMPLSLLGVVMPERTSAHTLTDATIREVLGALAPPSFRFWYRWMSALSRQYHLVTAAGSALTWDRGKLLNTGIIFDSQGEERVRQSKWHLTPEESRWGVSDGDGPPADPLRPWGLTTLVCNDATYPESFRIIASQGARIVVVPIADADPRYTVGKARRGCFSRVQDVPMVGVVAAATGRLFGLHLTGKAGIYLPAPLTDDGSGVLAESHLSVGEELISGVISLDRLAWYQERYRAEHPMPPADFLTALYGAEGDH